MKFVITIFMIILAVAELNFGVMSYKERKYDWAVVDMILSLACIYVAICNIIELI